MISRDHRRPLPFDVQIYLCRTSTWISRDILHTKNMYNLRNAWKLVFTILLTTIHSSKGFVARAEYQDSLPKTKISVFGQQSMTVVELQLQPYRLADRLAVSLMLISPGRGE
jgi:hypothetical protein